MKSRKRTYSLPIFIVSIVIGLAYAYITSKPNNDISTIQQGISHKIIRFHVIANSDSDADQALKLKVKEAVVNYTAELLCNSKSISETEDLLSSHTNDIISIANNVISENDYDYPVTAEITDTYFPTKSYGSYTFPPGTYRAFQIKIGEAKGKNWWCVLYPPLCFIDISHGTVNPESEELLKETLTTDEFQAVSDEYTVKYRFKYLTFLNYFIK
ncbi:stage II sporulation protein R [Bovifimicola ammoniilytica]|uniref:stage II sporulation protein R n=1 Tax=Bovifimicola ammoniilytica TaxID=2981720 RepID=UPI000820EE02|nr:stage II sporulation protein R [Bovifimicola ammoniilytica]MCU6752079.1 stage II sporulation protein R [Bovifimicola ammoniilytica]SCJ07456.1 stage II sporulation protein R [uncultured Eubacterium sp.]